MKTKIFLMAVIALLVAYILVDKSTQDKPSILVNNAPLQSSQTAVDAEPAVVKNNQIEIAQTNKTTVSTQKAIHDHSHDMKDDKHEHDDAEENHHNVPEKIKEILCIDDSDASSCTVDLDKNFTMILFDEAGNMLAEEITTVLDSTNFQEVAELLSTQKETNEAFQREDGYQIELDELTSNLNIESSPLYCSEVICAMTMQYDNVNSSKAFFEKFFNKSNKGNIFLSQRFASDRTTIVERVIFFPGNRNGVIVPELN